MALPFELEAEFAKELDRRFEVVDDDANVVHPFKPTFLLFEHVADLRDTSRA